MAGRARRGGTERVGEGAEVVEVRGGGPREELVAMDRLGAPCQREHRELRV